MLNENDGIKNELQICIEKLNEENEDMKEVRCIRKFNK